MADLAATIQQVGAPLGILAITAVTKEWQGTVTNRLWGYVDFYALDSSYTPVACCYALTAALMTAGTIVVVPAGDKVTLPFYQVQSYFWQRIAADSNLYAMCVG